MGGDVEGAACEGEGRGKGLNGGATPLPGTRPRVRDRVKIRVSPHLSKGRGRGDRVGEEQCRQDHQIDCPCARQAAIVPEVYT